MEMTEHKSLKNNNSAVPEGRMEGRCVILLIVSVYFVSFQSSTCLAVETLQMEEETSRMKGEQGAVRTVKYLVLSVFIQFVCLCHSVLCSFRLISDQVCAL